MGGAVRTIVIDLRKLRRLGCTSRWSLIPDIWLPSRQRATSRTVANKGVTSGTNCFSRSVGLSLVIHLPRDCYRRRGGHESMSRAKTEDHVWLSGCVSAKCLPSETENALPALSRLNNSQ